MVPARSVIWDETAVPVDSSTICACESVISTESTGLVVPMPTWPVELTRIRSEPFVERARIPGEALNMPVSESPAKLYAGAPAEPIGFARRGKLGGTAGVTAPQELFA